MVKNIPCYLDASSVLYTSNLKMLCRRSKYVDFFICASFCLLFVYAYFSRQVLLDRLRRKELERERLEHNANSLKEELKIVYYHTAKLEEALKAEQDNHKTTNSKLASQSQDFKVNITNIQRHYADQLQEKNDDIKTYSLENEDLKRKHEFVEENYSRLVNEHKKIALKAQTDFSVMRKTKEEESLHLQDQIQETYNQKVYYQKKAIINEDDYRKTLKKLVRCKSVLARRNSSTHAYSSKAKESRRKISKSDKRKKGDEIITDVLPTEVGNEHIISKSEVLPAQIITDLILDTVLPTTMAETASLPTLLSTENVNADLTTTKTNVNLMETPAELPAVIPKEKLIRSDAENVSKDHSDDEEHSREKNLRPIFSNLKGRVKTADGMLDDIGDYT